MENKKQTEEKVNPLLKILKYIGQYFKNIGFDIVSSFKYNRMKLAGLLVAVPGIFLGFFLTYHIPVVNSLAFTVIKTQGTQTITTVYFPDISAIILFLLVLFGILNLFTAFSMMSKKNLGSVISATVTTAIILITGCIYLYMVFLYKSLVDADLIKLAGGAKFEWSMNYIMSVGSVVISMVCSVAGIILGYIKYDRNYKKVNF